MLVPFPKPEANKNSSVSHSITNTTHTTTSQIAATRSISYKQAICLIHVLSSVQYTPKHIYHTTQNKQQQYASSPIITHTVSPHWLHLLLVFAPFVCPTPPICTNTQFNCPYLHAICTYKSIKSLITVTDVAVHNSSHRHSCGQLGRVLPGSWPPPSGLWPPTFCHQADHHKGFLSCLIPSWRSHLSTNIIKHSVIKAIIKSQSHTSQCTSSARLWAN